MNQTPNTIKPLLLCLLFLSILSTNFGHALHATEAETTTSAPAPTEEIFFVLAESTNIFNAFDALKQLQVNVKELNGFYVETTGTEAQVNTLKQALKAKSYLSAKSDIYDDAIREPEVSYSGGRIIVKLTFFNLTAADMDDFIQFMTANKLKISDGDALPYKWGLASAKGDPAAQATMMKGHPLVALAKQNKVIGVK